MPQLRLGPSEHSVLQELELAVFGGRGRHLAFHEDTISYSPTSSYPFLIIDRHSRHEHS